MEKTIRDYIIKNSIFKGGERVVAGISGGADSTALLRVLISLADEFSLTIFAAHVNHNARGADSLADERFCSELCERLNIPVRVYNVDMPGYAKQARLSPEEAGRELRRRAFADALSFFNADLTVLAHNKNDQAETLLLRIIRGTGLAGLAGMRPVMGQIVRPLLCVTRAQIEEYLKTLNQPYRTDYTNGLDIYARNKIRNRLLPEIIADYNENAIKTLFRAADIFSLENDYMEKQAEEAYGRCTVPGAENALGVNALKALHPAVLSRVIRLAYKNAAGTCRDLSSERTNAVISLIDGETGRKVELPNGYDAINEYGCIYFIKRERKNCAQSYSYEITPETPVCIEERNCFALLTQKITVDRPFFAAELDYEKITRAGAETLVRSKRDGDRVYISGAGMKKLAGYFSDRKTPPGERASVPLLIVGGVIICAAADRARGGFIDARFRADGGARDKIRFYVYGDE